MRQTGNDLDRPSADWPRRTLGELCSVRSGGTPPKSDPTLWSGDVPWVSGKDLKSSRLTDTVDHITYDAAQTYSCMAPAGSVLALVRGMGLAKSFPVSLIDRPMAFNQDIKALIPNAELSGAFLVHWLTFAAPRMLDNTSNAAHGTKRLGHDDLVSFPLPIPPMPDQLAIAGVLDHVGAAIAIASTIENKTQALKSSVMRELFTRGLRGEAQKEIDFGRAPESWRVTPLDHCAGVQTGVAKGRKFPDEEMVELPYLRVANVQDGHLDLTEIKSIQIRCSEIERYRLQTGDVLLTEGGDFDKLGRGFIWRGEVDLCIHQNHVFAVRPDPKQLTPEFFAYLAQSAYGKSYFLQVAHKTTNLACINTAKLKAFPVILPVLDEQRDIVAILDSIDCKLALHNRKRTLLAKLFKSLLSRLMTGEIRVADLDLSALGNAAAGAEAAA